MAAHRDANLVEKEAKDARWPNMYGDLNPLPDVQKDMVAEANVRPIKWSLMYTQNNSMLKLLLILDINAF